MVQVTTLNSTNMNATLPIYTNPLKQFQTKVREKIQRCFSSLKLSHQPTASFRIPRSASSPVISKSKDLLESSYEIETTFQQTNANKPSAILSSYFLKTSLLKASSINGSPDASLKQIHLNFEGCLCQAEWACATFVYDQSAQQFYLLPGAMLFNEMYLNGKKIATLDFQRRYQQPDYLQLGVNKVIFNGIEITIQINKKSTV